MCQREYKYGSNIGEKFDQIVEPRRRPNPSFGLKPEFDGS